MQIPKTIKSHRYGKWLGWCWSQVNRKKGIITIVITGKRGAGKSYVGLYLAELLDRGVEDVKRFNVEKVCLSVEKFLEWLNKPELEMKRGTVIILDDAGMYLYSRDALTKTIKRINRSLQNIRFVHPIIIMTVPFFPLLEKLSREFCDFYIEIYGRDEKRKLNMAKVQEIEVNPYTGDIYRKNISFKEESNHWGLKMDFIKEADEPFYFGLPSMKLVKEYERRHTDVKRKFNIETEKFVKDLDKQKQKIKRMDFPQASEYLKKNLEKFVVVKGDERRIEDSLIMNETNEQGKPLFSFDVSRRLARLARAKGWV